MVPETLTSHIASQILHPFILISTAKTQDIIRAKVRLVDIPKCAQSKLTISHEDQLPPSPSHAPPLPLTPTPSTPPPALLPSLSSLIHLGSLVLPKRLLIFLNLVSIFSPEYGKSFRSACTDLAILETISLLPAGTGKEEIEAWIEEQVHEICLEGLEDHKKSIYSKIMLNTTIGGVQIGLLMGVGILRSELSDSEDGKMQGILEWIEEGEKFVSDLEVLREVICERYSPSNRETSAALAVSQLHVDSEQLNEMNATGKEATPKLPQLLEFDVGEDQDDNERGSLSLWPRAQIAHDMRRMSEIFWEERKLLEKQERVKGRVELE